MLDFGTKVDNGVGAAGILTAVEFNNYIDELENAVTNTGQTLDATGTDVTQLSKAASIYAAGSDFYTATGTNTYVLSTVGSFLAPVAYFDGMRVRAVIGNANTGASTVNVDSLGAKNVFNSGAALSGGELDDNVELVFDNGNDRFNLIRSGDDGTAFSGVTSVSGGTNINVSGTASVPIVNLDAAITGTSVNGVSLSTGSGTNAFLNGAGSYSTSVVQTITAGTLITNTGTAQNPTLNVEGAEAGTFTPTLTATSGSGTSVNSGSYTRIGDLVYINIRIFLSAIGSLSGSLTVGALPFDLASGDNDIGVFCQDGSALNITSGTSITGSQILSGNDSFPLMNWDQGTGVSPLQASELSSSGDIQLTGFYKA
ncbi:MAG: hypothetical protein V3V40_05920 [Nitrosomonadaceae bacterium]